MSVASKIFVPLALVLLAACGKRGDDGESPPYVPPQEPFPHLGTSASFAALAAHGVANTGATKIYGDVGSSAGSHIRGLESATRTGGAVHEADSAADRAQRDAAVAYQNLENSSCDQDLSGRDLGGMTLTPGTYCFSDAASLTGLLTLDFQGNKYADFVFKIGSTLTTAADSGIRMINGGEGCNVFWQVAQTASLGVRTNIVGGVLALGDINMNSGARLNGKLLTRNGAISIDSSEIYNNFCPWAGQ